MSKLKLSTPRREAVPGNAFKVGTSGAALRPWHLTILIWEADRHGSVTSRFRIRRVICRFWCDWLKERKKVGQNSTVGEMLGARGQTFVGFFQARGRGGTRPGDVRGGLKNR